MLHFIKCRGCISPVYIPQSPLLIYAMVTIESTFYHFLKKQHIFSKHYEYKNKDYTQNTLFQLSFYDQHSHFLPIGQENEI